MHSHRFIIFSSTFIIALVAIIYTLYDSAPRPSSSKIMTAPETIKVTSPAFANGGIVPAIYTCDASASENSPPLVVENIPPEAKFLALIMDDPDAPVGTWDHWVRFNIPIPTSGEKWELATGQEPGGVAGRGTSGQLEYQGPCPPSGEHRYVFTVLALTQELNLPAGASKAEVLATAVGKTLATGQLLGRYHHP